MSICQGPPPVGWAADACVLRHPAGQLLFREARPHLVQQLHPGRNPTLDLDTVTTGSERKVWWRCRCPTCGAPHEWQAVILNRALKGQGCPWCTGERPCR